MRAKILEWENRGECLTAFNQRHIFLYRAGGIWEIANVVPGSDCVVVHRDDHALLDAALPDACASAKTLDEMVNALTGGNTR